LKLNLETELRRNVFGASGERYRLLRASGFFFCWIIMLKRSSNSICTKSVKWHLKKKKKRGPHFRFINCPYFNWYHHFISWFLNTSWNIDNLYSDLSYNIYFIDRHIPYTVGPSWLWSYGSWHYNYMYLCHQNLSPPKLCTCAIKTYRHQSCEFGPSSIQHYVMKFVSDLRQVGGLLQVLRFPPPIKLTAMI
jgi:hypothetical protein